jgi:hypothetical protein
MYSHALQGHKSHTNKNYMQNVHVVSRSKFYVRSNGALAFAVCLILCAGKCIKIFTETVPAFNLHFQHIGLNLPENKVHHSKERTLLI